MNVRSGTNRSGKKKRMKNENRTVGTMNGNGVKRENKTCLAPTTIIVMALLFTATVAMLRTRPALLAAAAVAVSATVIARPSLRGFTRRFCAALPFITFAALSAYFSDLSLERPLLMVLRISVSVTVLIILTMVLSFHDLLVGLQRLHMPRLLVLLLLFTHRYISVFSRELERMKTARKARGFTGGRHLFDRHGMHVISAAAGMIFVRALGRGGSISQALRMRGFDGQLKMPFGAGKERWSGVDHASFVLATTGCALLLMADLGFIGTRCMEWPF